MSSFIQSVAGEDFLQQLNVLYRVARRVLPSCSGEAIFTRCWLHAGQLLSHAAETATTIMEDINNVVFDRDMPGVDTGVACHDNGNAEQPEAAQLRPRRIPPRASK
jgi:hypothetical protein